jgi:hypothetical protein
LIKTDKILLINLEGGEVYQAPVKDNNINTIEHLENPECREGCYCSYVSNTSGS